MTYYKTPSIDGRTDFSGELLLSIRDILHFCLVTRHPMPELLTKISCRTSKIDMLQKYFHSGVLSIVRPNKRGSLSLHKARCSETIAVDLSSIKVL